MPKIQDLQKPMVEHTPLNVENNTITIANNLKMPQPHQLENTSLQGRVTLPKETILKKIANEVIDNVPKDTKCYSTELRKLIATMLIQYQLISEKDKLSIHSLKKEYKDKTLTVCDLQRKLGWSNWMCAFVVFGSSFLQLHPEATDATRVVAKAFQEVLKGTGELWSTDTSARISSGDKLCQLLMNEYSMISQAEGSKANEKQQTSAILDKLYNLFGTASRAG